MNKTALLAAVATLGLLLSLSSTADARAQRPAQIPNGASLSCQACHTSLGGGPRNPFGQAVEMMGLSAEPPEIAGKEVVWADVAMLDSDGDGFTNGQELGDPDGTWMIGDDDPVFDDLSAPGDSEDFPAGEGDDGMTAEGGGTPEDDDEGCQVAPGNVGSSAMLFVLAGLAFVLRRRR